MKIHALGLTSSQFKNISCTTFSSGRLGMQRHLLGPVQLGSACSVNEALILCLNFPVTSYHPHQNILLSITHNQCSFCHVRDKMSRNFNTLGNGTDLFIRGNDFLLAKWITDVEHK
jgi:hypothetical protein